MCEIVRVTVCSEVRHGAAEMIIITTTTKMKTLFTNEVSLLNVI